MLLEAIYIGVDIQLLGERMLREQPVAQKQRVAQPLIGQHVGLEADPLRQEYRRVRQ